ncbi:hypothetical protein ACOSQ3_009201 [Xanthoceras sorbifolium]
MAFEDAQNSSFISTSSRGDNIQWKYDVFLNFRGEDTRNNFTDHLYVALDHKRFITFIDDERLERGRAISSDLLEAIERSRLSIVIFSKKYAYSTWCLDELVKIVECMEMRKQYVVPVFHYIDQTFVQEQKGEDFENAFDDYEKASSDDDDLEKVQKWREALTKVASIIPGWPLQDSSEAQFIKDIVDEVSRKLIQEWKYDIFLSFRAADTGKTFTDHLYSALDKKGFKTFRDVQELERSSGREMLEPIEQSRLSIIILSKNYASSTRCLDDAVKIVECMKEKNQTLFPIFYDVDPWEVQKQRRNFWDAFRKHDHHQSGFSKEKVQRWRDALREVANLSGYNLRDRSEAKFIKDIVDDISRSLRGTSPSVVDYQVDSLNN